MALWDIVHYDPKTKAETVLGRVRAANSGSACLKAYEKFAIATNAEQRQIAARPVAKRKPVEQSPEEMADIKKVSAAFRGILRKA